MALIEGIGRVYALSLLLALAYYPVLGRGPRARLAGALVVLGFALPLPLLIPTEAVGGRLARLLLAIHCAVLGGKALDLHLGFATSGRPSFRAYLPWMALYHPWDHCFRRRDEGPLPETRRDLTRAALGALELTLGVGLLGWAIQRSAPGAGPLGFWGDHLPKVLATYLLLTGSARALCSARRLLSGRRTRIAFRDPALAHSPADFWRRWNTPVNVWLSANVWQRLSAKRHPLRASLVAFCASALGHEYMFAIAAERITGYQLAFFGVQGLAATLTLRLRPRGWRRGLAWLATLAFGLATSPLFFASAAPLLADWFVLYPQGGLLP